MYPLERLVLGVWESQIHEQIFLMVPPLKQKKIIFVVEYPSKEHSQPEFNQQKFINNLTKPALGWFRTRKELIKLWGDRNPFAFQGKK
jgi:hypothetical protein